MSIEISRETEARLTDEARRQGVSVESFLQHLMSEHAARVCISGVVSDLPVWHLGTVGPLHRRDIYDDVR
jgi:hypothetical protein